MILHKKRLILIILVLLALAATTAFVGWNYIIPNYRPQLKEGEVYGIDVSNHQAALDWKKVAADDIDFVYIKATEGSNFIDQSFDAHWAGAQQAGIATGAYHFFSLCSPGVSQAESFLAAIPLDDEMLLPALDLELSPFCTDEPSKKEVLKQIDDFVNLVTEQTSKEVILYVGKHFDAEYDIKDHYKDAKYWQLKYLTRTSDQRDSIWQVGYFFNVDGAASKLDLNVGRIEDL